MLDLKTLTRRFLVPLLVFLAWTPAAYAWSWPVQGPVVQSFVYDESQPYASGQHRGVDIGADAGGETVVAPAAGTVGFAGFVPTNGETVSIETADGYTVTLTHLGSILVARGATVAEQDPVGTIGPSGTAEIDGPYVHLGIRLTADPEGYVDPLGLLPAPATESPPTNSDPAASQPTATGGWSATTTATTPASTTAATTAAEPAPEVSASTPVRSVREATVRTSRPATSRPGRSRAPSARPEARRPPSSQASAPRAKVERTAIPHARTPLHRASEPSRSPRRPVVEAATPGGPTGLGAGHEPAPIVHAPQPFRRPAPQTSGALLPLVCNGAAALVAVVAALAAAWRRRREHATPVAGAEILHLPDARVKRAERRAA